MSNVDSCYRPKDWNAIVERMYRKLPKDIGFSLSAMHKTDPGIWLLCCHKCRKCYFCHEGELETERAKCPHCSLDMSERLANISEKQLLWDIREELRKMNRLLEAKEGMVKDGCCQSIAATYPAAAKDNGNDSVAPGGSSELKSLEDIAVEALTRLDRMHDHDICPFCGTDVVFCRTHFTADRCLYHRIRTPRQRSKPNEVRNMADARKEPTSEEIFRNMITDIHALCLEHMNRKAVDAAADEPMVEKMLALIGAARANLVDRRIRETQAAKDAKAKAAKVLQVWEIINPSDPYTIAAYEHIVAACCVAMLGNGNYGIEGSPILRGWDKWIKDQGIPDLGAWVGQHEMEVIECLESVLIGKPKSREKVLKEVENMNPAERIQYLTKRHDRMRSSANDIGGRAWEYAKDMRAKRIAAMAMKVVT